MIGQDQKIIGYLPTYRFSLLEEIQLERLTHLNIAFANPDNSGNLVTNDIPIDDVVQKAHEEELQVFISLAGGASQLATWEFWLMPENRPDFISNIIDYTKEHNLQGVDVDLEWGTVNDDYSGFVLELKDSLNQYNLLMTAALPGTYRYPEVSDEALAAFEWVNLMVYDLTGPWQPSNPGPHSPYSFAINSIDYWLRQGLEKERMTLGVPFYGYDFTNQSNVKSVKYSQMVEENAANAQLDKVGEIYYNGLPTITEKTMLAKNELSGIMIWELGQDHFSKYSLLRRIDETMNDFQVTATSTSYDLNDISVFPNPVSDHLKIDLGLLQDVKITLYSPTAKAILTSRYEYQDFISIDMNDYTNGMYLLAIESTNSKKVFKLVKY
ncbi:MAG: T9SS type A sorting domain-containing protein [Leptolyngbya sp. SIO3F4]|nr:T9SS type A sorting domain-containing protein [Leptolyngbya sp. SIO3F4]